MDIRKMIERETLKFKLGFMPPIAVTVIACGGSLISAYRSGHADIAVLAAGIWGLMIIMWWFVIKIYRRTLSPHTATATAYLDLYIERRRKDLVLIRASVLFYGAVYVLVLSWRYVFNIYGTTQDFWTAVAARVPGYVIATAIFLIVLQWVNNKTKKQMDEFVRLRRELTHES